MSLRDFPNSVKEFSLQIYKRTMDEAYLLEHYVAYTGLPQNHYSDPDKVILITDPLSRNTSFYEFVSRDISFVEELTTTVDLDGHAVPLARIWVRKGSVALRSTPFVVADTSWG